MTRSPHSLFATDKRAREALSWAKAALWFAVGAWVVAGVALSAVVVARVSGAP